MKKQITKLKLNPNEMAFRKVYWPLLKDGSLSTVFRPGVRIRGCERGYYEGQVVEAKVIDYIGADWAGIPPEFVDGLAKKIKIESVYVKRINELVAADFIGSSPDIFDQHSLKYHLGVIYNLFPEELDDDSQVTIIRFSHLPMKGEIENLIEKKDIVIAKEPQDNEYAVADFARKVTLSLVAHDYQAKTPVMWNALYRNFQLEVKNLMFLTRAEKIADVFAVLRRDKGYLGGGIGVGFKDLAIEHLDEVDPIARSIGAVNIVVKQKNGELKGYNTDGAGYVDSLEELLARRNEKLKGKKVVLLGAGGTANAIAFMLAERGANIVILNRTMQTAETLADRINKYFQLSCENSARFGGENLIAQEVADADVVINASVKGSIGNLEEYSALAPAILPANGENVTKNLSESKKILQSMSKSVVISDVVLRSGQTPLLALAESMGFETLNGVPMVINQGVEAVWLIHGSELESKGFTKQDAFLVMKNAAQFA